MIIKLILRIARCNKDVTVFTLVSTVISKVHFKLYSVNTLQLTGWSGKSLLLSTAHRNPQWRVLYFIELA